MSVSDLAQPFDVTLAAIVQHIQVLEESGIIRSEKVGRIRICRLEPDGLKVAERWISERRALWERRFARLVELLTEDDKPKNPSSPTKKRRKRP